MSYLGGIPSRPRPRFGLFLGLIFRLVVFGSRQGEHDTHGIGRERPITTHLFTFGWQERRGGAKTAKRKIVVRWRIFELGRKFAFGILFRCRETFDKIRPFTPGILDGFDTSFLLLEHLYRPTLDLVCQSLLPFIVADDVSPAMKRCTLQLMLSRLENIYRQYSREM